MTDEIKKLQHAIANEPDIKASMQAKNAAMKAALSAFEENNANAHQGSADGIRHKEQDNKTFVDLLPFLRWRNPMKLSYLLPSAAGLAAVTLVVMNTNQFTTLYRSDELPAAAQAPIITPTPKKQLKPKLKAKVPTPALALKDLDSMQMSQGKSQALSKGSIAKSIKRDERRRSEVMKLEMDTLSRSNMAQTMLGDVLAPAPIKERMSVDIIAAPQTESGRDKFEEFDLNTFKVTDNAPVSTFSIDVDTASYSFMRASINRNVLPQKNSVRVEELINYFPYDYPLPESKAQPFSVNTTVLPTPWNGNTKLLHIGIKGYEIAASEKPSSNLVFLLDTSGSMNQPNKLPLLKNAFKLLLSTLSDDDTVSIVVYAGSAGTVLAPTKVSNKSVILNALEQLRAGGSTAGGAGIKLAYQLAESNFDANGVNRVILATDGDFNVGIRDQNELKSFIERKRNSGVTLSVLGFGMGNYNDALMQTLAQNGNGNAAYIDSLSEARKVLVEQASSTLFTIAKDVKIQMEFNPLAVKSYRLIGYETRQLNREDFNNDKVDAGDIGAGHTVTAIYEITPVGATNQQLDPLRYATPAKQDVDTALQTEYGFLKLRYKLPDASKSKLIEHPIVIDDTLNEVAQADTEVRFATSVAAYGQLLRGGKYTADYGYDEVIKLAQSAKGTDEFGYRAEFITLVRLAKTADGASN